MATTARAYEVEDHFAGKDHLVREVRARPLAALGPLGPVGQGAKKPSIHPPRRAAFAWVQAQRWAISLNIRAGTPLISPRVRGVEPVSADRFHQTATLTTLDEVDEELLGWLAEAYALSA